MELDRRDKIESDKFVEKLFWIYIFFFNYRERKRRNEWKSGQRDEFSRDEHWRRIVSRVSRGESTSYLTYRRIKTA